MIDEQMARQECARLRATWKALSEITVDLKQRGVDVPPDIYKSLRGINALTALCKEHPELKSLVPGDIDTYQGFCVACCDTDIVARLKCELRSVGDWLVFWATKELGNAFAMELQERIRKAWEPVEKPVAV
jgi:hypothetical protein